jgi:hypothetical protein
LAGAVTDRYWPRRFDELEGDRTPVTWLNEPPPPDNVSTLAPRQRSIHAVLVENLNSTQALLTRLESGRVRVARAEQREVVRLLYVATRHQVKALAAVLELEGLE